uniref:Uncharacterized protein n=1 Tax=Anopheles atroparvus TaxID=41427 RepID=A0AAG5DIQ6_ANOAO
LVCWTLFTITDGSRPAERSGEREWRAPGGSLLAVEVEQQLEQRGRSDVAPEEQLLDGVAGDAAQERQQLEQGAVAVGGAGPAGADVGGERLLGALLERPHRGHLAERLGAGGGRAGAAGGGGGGEIGAVGADAGDASFAELELALVQHDRAQVNVLVRIDAQCRQLAEDLLEDLDLLEQEVGGERGARLAAVQVLVGEQQLAEVDRRQVLRHGQDEELAPRLLEQHQLVGHRELRERRQVLQEVDVHEEQLGGRLPDRVHRHQRVRRRRRLHACGREQRRHRHRRQVVVRGGRGRATRQRRTGGRWRRQERVAAERQVEPERRTVVRRVLQMVMVVLVVVLLVMVQMVRMVGRQGQAGREHHVVAQRRVLRDEQRHLLAQRRVARAPLVLHRVLVHAHLEAFLEPAGAALVAVRLVHHARPVRLRLAHVLAAAADRPLEEPGAPIARVDTVVLARAVIAADLARHI